MKKLLAIALASVMAFSTPLTVSAEEIVVSGGTFEAEEYAEEESESAGTEDVTGANLGKVDFEDTTLADGTEDLGSRYGVNFKLSSAMIAEKISYLPVLDDLRSVTPGRDYIDGQLVVKAENKSMAQSIAEGFQGELQSYQNGIAVFNTKLSTAEAVALAADQNMQLPAVYPNYIYTTDDLKYEPVDMDALPEIAPETSAKIKELQESVKPRIPEEVSDDTGIYEGSTGSDSVSENIAKPNDEDIDLQWYHEKIDTFAAWKAAPKMGEGITVAVIDSGIDETHPEFKGRVITALDGSGITSPLDGNHILDNDGHGTHVAGIIGAEANNGIGGAGIAPKVNILAIKALEVEVDDKGKPTGNTTGTTADIVSAMIYAMGIPSVRVINMSLGGPSGVLDILYQMAVDAAIEEGIVVVAAAGNEGWDISNSEYASSPACLDGVVAVASLDVSGVLSNFSNYGAVDISAPGGTASEIVEVNGKIGLAFGKNDIYSTFPIHPTYSEELGKGYKEGYTYMAGTSQACPVVSGVIALMLSNSEYEKSRAGVEKVVDDLKKAAVNIGKEKTYGAGRVNAAAAVGAGSVYTKDNNYDVVAGKKLTLAAKMGMGNTKPVWDVSNKEVCTITQKGVLKAAKTVSENTVVTVTATANEKSATATVTIWPKAATLTRKTAAKSAKLKYHQTEKFEVTASCNEIQAPVVYKSSNNKVAAVDQKGTISALANGKATITATTVGGKKATFKVTVTDTPYYIERIIPANKKDRQGAEMFALSPYLPGLEASPVSEGKSIKYKAIAAYPYNTAASRDKKMEWAYVTDGIVGWEDKIDETGNIYSEPVLKSGENEKKITFNNGVLKVSKNLSVPTIIKVYGRPQGKQENVCGNIAVAFRPLSGVKVSKSSVTVTKGSPTPVEYTLYKKKGETQAAMNLYLNIESSNADIAEVALGIQGDSPCVIITGKKPGKCKVTLTSMDGAYKKATINVTVK